MKKLELLLVLMASIIAITTHAHDFSAYSQGQLIYYNVLSSSDRTCEVTYKGTDYYNANSYSGDIVIPETVNGYTVTGIGEYAFYYCNSLGDITLPRTINHAGTCAFEILERREKVVKISDLYAWCQIDFANPSSTPLFRWCKLELNGEVIEDLVIPSGVTVIKPATFTFGLFRTITIPEGVTSIGHDAFCGCRATQVVYIPNSLNTLSAVAFQGFYGTFVLSDTHPTLKYFDGLLYSKDMSDLIYVPSSKTTFSIPEEVKKIKEYCFANSDITTTDFLPSTIEEIEQSAFVNCNNLKTVYLPQNLKTIDPYAFLNCLGISDVYVNPKLKQMGKNFYNVTFHISDLSAWCNIDGMNETFKRILLNESPLPAELYIPIDVDSIKNNAFKGTEITSVTLPSSLKYLGNSVFSNCKNLQTVEFNSDLEEIPSSAFCQCTSLENINLPSTIKTIGGGAFSDCNLLNISKLPDNLEWIGGSSFEKCTSLESITLPSKLTEISWSAFFGCTNIKTVINRSPLNVIAGQTDNGYVAYYATEVINEKFMMYDGNRNLILPSTLEDAFSTRTSDNALVFTYINTTSIEPNIVTFISDNEWEADAIEITDAQPFYSPYDFTANTVTYTRTFGNTSWQAMYVPFNIAYEEWADKGIVAKINNVHQFDDNNDGQFERTIIEFKRVFSGELKANTPYVFKPLSTGSVKFTCTNKTIKATPEGDGYVDCSSTEYLYTLAGCYQPKTDMYDSGAYALKDGAFTKADVEGLVLSPFRIYLTITERDGNYHQRPNTNHKPQKISIMVDGEITSIEGIAIDYPDDNCYYDLMGRPVKNPANGIFIKNGNKVIIK